MDNNHRQKRLSVEEYEVRIWGFVVIAVTCILLVIVVALLYSVTFVTQPIKSMAPIDQAYTKMLNDIVLLIVGGIGGVMSKRAVGAVAKSLGEPPQPSQSVSQQLQTMAQPIVQQAPKSVMPDFNWMGYKNPELDESWTPGPPPTTPSDYLHPEREEIALERLQARGES